MLGVNNGTSTADVSVQMRVLIGDTNGDGFVNSGDAFQTRSHSEQVTMFTNFRSDVNTDGVVNSGDTMAVPAHSGTFCSGGVFNANANANANANTNPDSDSD